MNEIGKSDFKSSISEQICEFVVCLAVKFAPVSKHNILLFIFVITYSLILSDWTSDKSGDDYIG